MTREQLEHIIRAAGANADTNDIVVIGSQAILATYSKGPQELLSSIEADVFPRDHPERSILIDGAIGERSIFHETFGYYAHGVDAETAILPEGWRDRLIPICNENTRGVTGWCLDVHDLAISKLAAGRSKDLLFVRCLATHKMIDPSILNDRLNQLSVSNSEMLTLYRGRVKALPF